MCDTPRAALLAATLLACAACGPKTATQPPPPKPTDPDTEAIVHTWIVSSHMRVKGASITDDEAIGYHGRTIVITPTGFNSPWQPPCERANREKRAREMGELFDELEIAEGGATKAASFGMTSDILEFRLTCTERNTPLIVWVGGKHAMTCFSGACFLMKRFEDE